jgi:2-hydroxychromene-2-carboxylate isomerase
VVSPFAYLLLAALKKQKLALSLQLKPVLFAALLNHFGQKGPAEIAPKRLFTYEQCTFIAQSEGIPFRMPQAHPFNPIRYLRLIVALGARQRVIDVVFDTLFNSGLDPEDDNTFQLLIDRLEVHDAAQLISSDAVKNQLRANTDAAIAAGVFGVPTIQIDERLFWGFDSLPMVKAYLAKDGSLETPAMQAARAVRLGAVGPS